MKEIYQVVHRYDVDGGFGDAVAQEDVIRVFEDAEDAEEFIKKFENPHVYDTPYNELWCGDLKIQRMEIIPKGGFDPNTPEHFWWLDEGGNWGIDPDKEIEIDDEEEELDIDDEEEIEIDNEISKEVKVSKVSKERKIEEAVKRMKTLGIFNDAIKQFQKQGIVMMSEPTGGLYWIDDEQKHLVQEFEQEYGSLVYLVVRSYTTVGRMDSFLYVSDEEEEWEMDNEDVADGYAMTFTHNYDAPWCSEFGTIAVAEKFGGLVRVG